MTALSDSYDQIKKNFQWEIPEFFNIGVDVCDKWADINPQRIALIEEDSLGNVTRLSFGDLQRRSNQLANYFVAQGLARGDRIAVLLPQSIETALAHIAIYKMGAVAVPLFTLFGPDALEFRLSDSGCRLLITDDGGALKMQDVRQRLPALQAILVVEASEEAKPGTLSFDQAVDGHSTAFEPVATTADDPAVIIYTSGTTGKPKGALHAHRVLLGHLPGVEMSHGGEIDNQAKFWTPADWAWIGGLLDVLLPALHHGVPVLAHRFPKFEAAAAFSLMERHRITHVFLPPTALKMLRLAPDPRTQWKLALRSVASGGETLGAEMLAWGRYVLGVDINEFYGQTECNMVVSSCSAWFHAKPGAIGKAAPGHVVRIVDHHGAILPAGAIGEIGIQAPDPVMFLGYWNNPDATAAKFAGNFLLTGDQGRQDDEGFIQFVGRDDDVITSAGYRIGPGPIEDCLLSHAAVRMAAVVGAPDPQRTEVVKAFVVLNDGFVPSEALTMDLQAHVRTRLAGHEYPRIVRYVDTLPMTATGKVVRRTLRETS